MPFVLAEKSVIKIVLRQLHLIKIVGLENINSWNRRKPQPTVVTGAKMLSPDLLWCLFVKPCPRRPAATSRAAGGSRLVPFHAGSWKMPGEGVEKETSLLTYTLSISSFCCIWKPGWHGGGDTELFIQAVQGETEY